MAALVATGVAAFHIKFYSNDKKEKEAAPEDNEVLLYRFDPVVGKHTGTNL